LESVLTRHGVVLEDAWSSALWRSAGQLKAEWRRVSLADCFALALAIHGGGTLVTSDHHELEPIARAGLCPFLFIR
jgi:predicted nucleic acid-binding protein